MDHRAINSTLLNFIAGSDCVVFKLETTHDQIETFWEETLSTKVEKGHWSRPGIRGILRLFPVQGHEGIAVSFFPNATEAEREDIKPRLKSSRLVYKVMENIAPSDVKKIE